MSNNSYFSERSGIEKKKLNLKDLIEVFIVIVNDLAKDKYFNDFYGFEDNWGKWNQGKASGNFEAYVLSEIGRRISDPFYCQTTPKYAEEDVFDLIELLHKHIYLKDSYQQEQLGIYDLEGIREYSQLKFRERINDQISRYSKGWELQSNGEVRELLSEGFKPLIDEIAVYGNETEVDGRIRKAIRQFLKYGSDELTKKGALLEIGGALERIRSELTEKVHTEEQAIFTLLNKFDLRHNNKIKEAGYDTEIFYPWMFYTFLSTFDAFVKIRDRG
ncbi:hypothetical protein [Paenibacillus tepidiphilus]|uniref:hypothetical protein n=1 Tax=Paenibacillus tepidiphilus TaxID=2608683 RepID=UPI001239CB31|nr:hypothetical protein [Paenibacillus tepidiphilus]